MAFGGRQQPERISVERLAAVTGGGVAAAAVAAPAEISVPTRRQSVEPDLSRMRKSRIDETPEQRKKRLAAKTVNYGATFIARFVIIGAVGYFAWEHFKMTGNFHRGYVIGIFLMFADLGRIALKAMEPGGK